MRPLTIPLLDRITDQIVWFDESVLKFLWSQDGDLGETSSYSYLTVSPHRRAAYIRHYYHSQKWANVASDPGHIADV